MKVTKAAAAVALAAAMLTQVAVGTSSAGPTTTACTDGDEAVQSLKLNYRALHIVYGSGSTAKVKAKVIRELPRAPRQHGPNGAPAAEVHVGIHLVIGDVFLWGSALTNDNGIATIKIDLPRYAGTGWVDATGVASRRAVTLPCFEADETSGSVTKKLFFQIVR